MKDDVAFRNALEAVSHIGDPDPPWYDVLTSAKELIGADAATLLMFDSDQELILLQQTGIDRAAEQEYVSRYYKDDAIAHAALASPSGRWWDSVELQTTAQMRAKPFFSDYMPRHRMGQVLAFVIVGEPDRRAAVSFQRSASKQNAIQTLSRGKAATYTRALTAAIASREWRIRSNFELVEKALASENEAALICGPDGIIHRSSVHAFDFLRQARMLNEEKRAIGHYRRDVIAGLSAALSKSAFTTCSTSFVVPTSWGEGVRFDIAPAPSPYRLANEALLFVRLRKASAFTVPAVAELADFFVLTTAEARVLAALVAGHTVSEYAATFGVAERTVRNQIASVMRKMSCSRQSELVRLGAMLA
ncbi:helix-turn-helix transcriptional regulator [Paraburkholderia fungorum]|uniref:helix-turn-helix transcriptional regulator n=1 Tax=Paraburkholderia fungorum TaxID=134537 RepID=UPI0038B971CC